MQEAERNPAGGKLLFGAVDVALRKRGVARHLIGAFGVAIVEQLAGEETPLHPPFVEIVA